ncbi:MAG: proton-conducting transporter membrane subunit [Eubacteriales bacterium]|nr:proton-conducting transporter membrane subunit [Eubacteriales bacterium]
MSVPFVWNLPCLCIFLCMIAAILLSLGPRPRLAWGVTFGVAAVCALASLVFLMQIVRADTAFAYTMGKFPAPFGNEIKGGPLQGLFGFVFSLVMCLCLLGGRTDFFADVDEKKTGLACVMLCMVLTSLFVLTYTNDIFTAYVFIEISTIAACALVMVKDSGPTLVATVRYLFLSLLGSGMFLFGLVLLYAVTGHLLMPQLSAAVAKLAAAGEKRGVLALSLGLMTAGLGVKSAMFPFHRWLPDAHGSATTASSAVLSGLVVKGYAVLLILLYVRVFTPDTVRALRMSDAVFVLGFAGMILGSVRAIGETHVKRMLAWSTVAQLGYVFMGIGLGTVYGIAAACFQILAHAFAKPLLFVSAGRLSAVSGHDKQLGALRGAAWRAPLAGLGFGVGALSMVGIPLFGGFAAKAGFALGALSGGTKTAAALAVLALSSVLNALYYLPALINVWSGAPAEAARPGRDTACAVSILLLAAGVVTLGLCFGPVMDLILRGLALV